MIASNSKPMNPMRHLAYFTAAATTLHEHAQALAKIELDADDMDGLRAEIDGLAIRLADLRATLPQRSQQLTPELAAHILST